MQRTMRSTRIVFLTLFALVTAGCASDDATAPEPEGPPAAARIGAGGDDRAGPVVRTPNGFLMGASFQGAITVGGSPLVAGGTTDALITSHDSEGSVSWSAHPVGASSAGCVPTAFAVYAGGEFVVVGAFDVGVSFDGIDLTGTDDIFIARYTSTGFVDWAQRAGGTDLDLPTAVAIDAAGNFVVAGLFQGTAFFGTGTSVTSAGGYDIFLAKFSAAGGLLWIKAIGGTGDELAGGIAIDAADNIYLAGTFSGTVNLGFGNVSPSGPADGFVLALDSSAGPKWALPFGGTGIDVCNAVGVAPDGDIVFAGSFQNQIDLGGGIISSKGLADGIVARRTPSGGHEWEVAMGGSEADAAGSIALSSSQVIAGGSFRGGFYFYGDVAPRFTSEGETDGFVLALSPGGALQSAVRYGGPTFDDPGGVDFISGGTVVVGGFQGDASFGGQRLSSAGSYDIFRWVR